MENQLVVFDLANEHYGVDIAAVEGTPAPAAAPQAQVLVSSRCRPSPSCRARRPLWKA